MRDALVLVLALGGLCSPAKTTPPVPDPDPSTAALAIVPPAERGEPLDATIPLYRAGVARLQDLRGRVVVLELFAPSEASWAEAHEPWRALQDEHAAHLAVVTVAVATDQARLVERWDTHPPAHLVGWDPQAALALRLGIAALPTVILLDAQGRVVARGQDRAAMLTAARALL